MIDWFISRPCIESCKAVRPDVLGCASFGFRLGRGAHDAIRAREPSCRRYRWVVDIDLEKFFDRVNHDILMEATSRIADRRCCG